MEPLELARKIDHSALRPETSRDRIMELCGEARTFSFGAVCIAPVWISFSKRVLEDADVKVVTVIGFPHGNTLSKVKAYEAKMAVEKGADELDMVINLGALISGDYDTVMDDIRAVVEIAELKPGTQVKVIIETAILTEEEKVQACVLAEKAGADFVKTSTGFGSGGATIQDVKLLRKTVGNRLGVKASGGIRDLETALSLIEAGADRLGCSESVSIIKEFTENPLYGSRTRFNY
jgi:deoxyribose-phosphate aldolase